MVTNAAGSVTSGSATLTVNVPPAIAAQPQAASVVVGQPATFSVTATGTAPLAYQWRKNGATIASATNSSVTIASATTADAGTYDVVVSNVAGNVTSAGAVLTVNAPPTISAQPQSVSVRVGLAASFSVTAAGTAPLSYQWRKNGTPIAGATATTFAIATTTLGDAGTYDVIVTNPVTSVTSATATLTVTVVAVTVAPLSPNVGTQATQRFTATVTGTSNTSVSWTVQEMGGGTIDAAGNYTAPSTVGTYHVKATSNDDNTKSATATVTVFAAGSIRIYQIGLPVGVAATVHLAGPGGFTADLTEQDATVSGAPIGAYVVTIPSVTSGGTTFQPLEPGPTLNLSLTLNATLLNGVTFAPLAPVGVGSIAATGATAQEHIDLGAVLLPNGHALVTGGLVAITEDYDPATGVWTSVGSHGSTVDFFTPLALMTNGKVILASGGYQTASPTTWIYDPVPKSWSQAASLAVARTLHTVTALANGKVLVTGGFNNAGTNLASAELYDPVANTWTTVGSMSAARTRHTATLLANGKVLIVGGIAGAVRPGTAELFDPATNQFTVLSSTPLSGRWSHQAARLPNGKVVIVGGNGDNYLDIELFDPATNTFSSNARLKIGRLYLAASVLADGRVFINGGGSGDAVASTEIYNPTTGSVVFGPNLTVSRQEHQSVTLPNGTVLIVGGRGVNNTARKVVDLFTP